MEFLPEVSLGWLNGWLLLATLVLTGGVRVIAEEQVANHVEVRPEADELARIWERCPPT